MLSRKIDLTENRDFGRENLFDDTVATREVDDDDPISLYEYVASERHIYFFGKTKHSNEKRKLFGYKSSSVGPHGQSSIEDDIIPWKYVKIAKRIPWKRSNFMPRRVEEGRNDLFDLFNLR